MVLVAGDPYRALIEAGASKVSAIAAAAETASGQARASRGAALSSLADITLCSFTMAFAVLTIVVPFR